MILKNDQPRLKHICPTSAVHQVTKTSWLTLGISSVEAARFDPAPRSSVQQQPTVRLLALRTPHDNGKQKTRCRALTNIPPFFYQVHVTPHTSVNIRAKTFV